MLWCSGVMLFMADNCQIEQFIKLLYQLIPSYFLLTQPCAFLYCYLKDLITAWNCSFLYYLMCYWRPYFSVPVMAESFMMHGRNFTCKKPALILNGFRGIWHSSGALLLDSSYWIWLPVLMHDVRSDLWVGCGFSLLTWSWLFVLCGWSSSSELS